MVANFSAYFDASGTQHDKWAMTTAGVVAEVNDWTDFDNRWREVMGQNGVKHFRMHDFAHFKNDFAEGWKGPKNKEKRQAFLETLITFTNETAIRLYVTTLVLSHWRLLNGTYQAKEHWGGAFALAQAVCVERLTRWMIQVQEPTDGFQAFVEQGDVGHDAFRRLMRVGLGKDSRYILVTPKRSPDDEDYTPYHVADFVAYEYRAEHAVFAETEQLKMPRRGSLEAIRKMLYPQVGIIDYPIMEKACIDANVPLRKKKPKKKR